MIAEMVPVVFFVTGKRLLGQADLRSAPSSSGWRSRQVADHAAIDVTLDPVPALIVIDYDVASAALVAGIRATSRHYASVPILVMAASPLADAGLRARGLDGAISVPLSPADLVAAIAPWQPQDEPATIDRLERQFGTAPIRSMLARLRDVLADAVIALDDGNGGGVAHRVAGVAGTLGFAATSEAWLALAEAGADPRGDARRTARRSIALIDRIGPG